MIASDFNEISMNGRMAYLILCIEKYLITKYAGKDWTILSKILWDVTSNYWDEWDFKYVEIIPEHLFEFENFEDSDFEEITKEEYDNFSNLLKNMPAEVNKLLLAPHLLQEIYSYTSIPGYGTEASNIILNVCKILEDNNIELPSISAVHFSRFTEKNGWGEQFDGSKLSLILN